jgi:protease I
MKNVLILTWNGFQDQEVIYPYYRLLEEEFKVTIAAEREGTITGILGSKFEANLSVGTLSSSDTNVFDLLILPGGVKALEKLRQEKTALTFIRNYYDTGKVIGSTCHGAQLMISAKLVRGHRISGYYSIKDDINNAGALYVDEPYVISGNIVSSPHYKHMGPWMKAVIDQYGRFLKSRS